MSHDPVGIDCGGQEVCRLCGSGESRIVADHGWVQTTSLLRNSEVVQCLRCGFVFSTRAPVGQLLEQLNNELSVSFNTPPTRAQEKVALLFRDLQGIELQYAIDVGGGVGHFADCLESNGLPAWTYDPFTVDAGSRQIVELSRQGTGAHFFSFFHVLEHVPDPVSYLREFVDMTPLLPGDVVAIEVPVLELELISQPDPSPFLAPFHLSHFSIRTINDAIQLAGLRPFRSFAMPGYNGFMVLATKSIDDSVPDRVGRGRRLFLSREVALLDVYLNARSVALESLRQEFAEALSQVGSLVFWGLGLGFDAFISSVGFDLRAFAGSTVLIDQDEGRRAAADARFKEVRGQVRVVSPEAFLGISFSKPALVVPSSYAGKPWILGSVRAHPDSRLFVNFQGESASALNYVY